MTATSFSSALELPLDTHSADAVFEGGGVKGIAFVGALEAAAEIGITRWVNVAGTSAGAIVAALVATGHGAPDLRRILEATDYRQFADYGWGGKWIGGPRNALIGRGLCPGRAFSRWLEDRFAESPLKTRTLTFADLERDDLPAELSDEERSRSRFTLRVIASDISEGRMLVLPDDIEGYTDDDGRALSPETLEVARAVRMSMSFPYFFEPVRLWKAGQPHYIVDGGLLSNFPVFLFDGERPPLRRWTIGFRLYSGKPPEALSYHRVPRPLWYLPLAKAMFTSATEAWDRRLSAASQARTISIPTGKVPTLKFTLSKDDQRELSDNGRAAAEKFLREQKTYRNHSGIVAAGPGALEQRSPGS
jgi:NTE family protein